VQVRKRNGKGRTREAMAKELIKKSQARAFMKRWKFVNAVEKQAMQATPVDEKFNQLVILMISADELGWRMKLEGEVRKVRDRWNELREVYHV
jgi:hypothetical protein